MGRFSCHSHYNKRDALARRRGQSFTPRVMPWKHLDIKDIDLGPPVKSKDGSTSIKLSYKGRPVKFNISMPAFEMRLPEQQPTTIPTGLSLEPWLKEFHDLVNERLATTPKFECPPNATLHPQHLVFKRTAQYEISLADGISPAEMPASDVYVFRPFPSEAYSRVIVSRPPGLEDSIHFFEISWPDATCSNVRTVVICDKPSLLSKLDSIPNLDLHTRRPTPCLGPR